MLCLLQSAPQVLHLLLLTGAVVVLLVGFASIAFGDMVKQLSSLGGALRGGCTLITLQSSL